MFVHVV